MRIKKGFAYYFILQKLIRNVEITSQFIKVNFGIFFIMCRAPPSINILK